MIMYQSLLNAVNENIMLAVKNIPNIIPETTLTSAVVLVTFLNFKAIVMNIDMKSNIKLPRVNNNLLSPSKKL